MVHVPLMFLSEWREFPLAPCLTGKINLMTAHVLMLKSRASPDMLPFSLCNKKRLAIQHMNRPLFPTTLSIPSYNMGKYVGLRTYQHPLVHTFYARMSNENGKQQQWNILWHTSLGESEIWENHWNNYLKLYSLPHDNEVTTTFCLYYKLLIIPCTLFILCSNVVETMGFLIHQVAFNK